MLSKIILCFLELSQFIEKWYLKGMAQEILVLIVASRQGLGETEPEPLLLAYSKYGSRGRPRIRPLQGNAVAW